MATLHCLGRTLQCGGTDCWAACLPENTSSSSQTSSNDPDTSVGLILGRPLNILHLHPGILLGYPVEVSISCRASTLALVNVYTSNIQTELNLVTRHKSLETTVSIAINSHNAPCLEIPYVSLPASLLAALAMRRKPLLKAPAKAECDLPA